MTDHPRLERRLGTSDAVFIGLASMVGAGVFAAFPVAAASAGSWLLAGLAIAAVVAWCNAMSSAQLAARYTSAGGTYLYGREVLGPWWGFIAGWSFVIGKTASCAAMALTFAAYLVPAAWQKPVAVAAIVLITAVNYFGVTRTAAVAKVLVSFVIVVLLLVIVAALGVDLNSVGLPWASSGAESVTAYGILQSAGLLFFAFAGYARIATLGEEVRDPGTTIPRAISWSFALTVLLYVLVAVALLAALGSAQLAVATAPLVDVVQARAWEWAVPVVQLAAAVATLGALLALIAGIGRTSLAMARENDLPGALAAVHPKYSVPHRAELALAAVLIVVILAVDLRGAIGFSSFGVLLYYAVANASAFAQPVAERHFPRGVQLLGLLGCLVLAFTLPWLSVAMGITVLIVGLTCRVVTQAA